MKKCLCARTIGVVLIAGLVVISGCVTVPSVPSSSTLRSMGQRRTMKINFYKGDAMPGAGSRFEGTNLHVGERIMITALCEDQNGNEFVDDTIIWTAQYPAVFDITPSIGRVVTIQALADKVCDIYVEAGGVKRTIENLFTLE